MMNSVSQTISDETLNRIITIESGGNPKAKAQTSSATGLGQFLNTTWMVMVQRYRPEWIQKKTKQEVLDLRLDASKSIEMLARFTEENARAIPGSKDADGDLYLAHFSGVAVAKKLFLATPETPCESIYSGAAINANRSILEGKTCGEVRAWAEAKMRRAGGHKWVEKYWRQSPVATPPVERVIPRDRDPEGAPPEPKTGISEAAKVGGGFSLAAAIASAWDAVKDAPEGLITILMSLASKPAFWLAVGLIAVFAYIYMKRQKAKKEAEV